MSSGILLKIWIFKAWDCAGKPRLDWEFVDRSHVTFFRLFNRLKGWDVLFYGGDRWASFNKIIPQNRLFQGKDKTFFTLKNKGRQRHKFSRFHRKTLANSRSLEMIEITMRIFVAIHVNKNLEIKMLSLVNDFKTVIN